ncbi:MAG: hypothetical protein JJE23_03110 [Thermoleophilia bacterium]|nr:hypothetical protein [Thermoleophilia bacterium]
MSGFQLIQRPTALATLILAALAALIAALAGPAPALAGKSFQAATSGHNSELIETAPIERAAKRSRRVAFSAKVVGRRM